MHRPRITSGRLALIIDHHRPARPDAGAPTPHPCTRIRPLREGLEDAEKRIIIEALRACNGGRRETARALGIKRAALDKNMNKYGLKID
jgi:DNA-binding NtrC family response regulator